MESTRIQFKKEIITREFSMQLGLERKLRGEIAGAEQVLKDLFERAVTLKKEALGVKDLTPSAKGRFLVEAARALNANRSEISDLKKRIMHTKTSVRAHSDRALQSHKQITVLEGYQERLHRQEAQRKEAKEAEEAGERYGVSISAGESVSPFPLYALASPPMRLKDTALLPTSLPPRAADASRDPMIRYDEATPDQLWVSCAHQGVEYGLSIFKKEGAFSVEISTSGENEYSQLLRTKGEIIEEIQGKGVKVRRVIVRKEPHAE